MLDGKRKGFLVLVFDLKLWSHCVLPLLLLVLYVCVCLYDGVFELTNLRLAHEDGK